MLASVNQIIHHVDEGNLKGIHIRVLLTRCKRPGKIPLLINHYREICFSGMISQVRWQYSFARCQPKLQAPLYQCIISFSCGRLDSRFLIVIKSHKTKCRDIEFFTQCFQFRFTINPTLITIQYNDEIIHYYTILLCIYFQFIWSGLNFFEVHRLFVCFWCIC